VLEKSTPQKSTPPATEKTAQKRTCKNTNQKASGPASVVPLAKLTLPMASLSSDDVQIVEAALAERKAVLRRGQEFQERLDSITRVYCRPNFKDFSRNTGPAKWLLLIAIDKYDDPQIDNASGVSYVSQCL
jgi:hypothetical protein